MRKLLVLLITFTLFTAGCSQQGRVNSSDRVEVTVLGSTALLPLIRVAAKDFVAMNPKVSLTVSGGGSLTGLHQVAVGTADIGTSDVEPPTGDPLYRGLMDHVVGVIPFLLITHPDVGVDSLTHEQAVDIFTGKIKNWRAVGGKEMDITIIDRLKSSGSRQVIKEIILQGQEFTGNTLLVNSNSEVKNAVANTPGAIGFISANYLDKSVKAVKYNGVACNEKNVVNGTYPLFAAAHVYTKGEPGGAVKAFIEFLTSDLFQLKVKRTGLLTVSVIEMIGVENFKSQGMQDGKDQS